MPISQRELIRLYGEAVLTRNASLFVGAGLSLGAGYPTWPDLLKTPRRQARIPVAIQDLPLVAQYFLLSTPGGREALDSHILKVLASKSGGPTEGHEFLAQLPIDDIWTTNYDCLLEQSLRNPRVIVKDDDLVERRAPADLRLTKMHGSLTTNKPIEWASPPVITRSDYEDYERFHPRIWAALRATYLTRSFLFLGFSFTDPNIDLLLRLSRTLQNSGAPEHFTVLRKPDSTANSSEQRLHELKVNDLENSGIAVCEIADFAELTPMLEQLVRRTRRPILFVAGASKDPDPHLRDFGDKLGSRLADLEIEIISFGNAPGFAISFAFGRALLADNRYDASRFRFYFNQSEEPAPPIAHRRGTTVYTDTTGEEMRRRLLPQCRALVVMKGRTTTREEVEYARSLQLPVVPIPTTGGVARELYERLEIHDLLGTDITEDDRRDWVNLNQPNGEIAAKAAFQLIRRAMYLDS